MIAIGRPSERVPPIGAARFWVPHHEWQERVDELLGRCRAVVMIIGKIKGEDGLARDVRRLLGTPGDLEKTLLVMPQVLESERASGWAGYRDLSGGRLPRHRKNLVAARFDGEGIFHGYIRWGVDDEAYVELLKEAIAVLRRETGSI